MRDPVIADVRRDHPLARQLDLTDVNISAARRLALAPGDVAVAGSFGVPLLIARERPGLRIAATSFDPRRSDLPMRPAFPLLIANALAWAPGANADAAIEAPPALLTGASARPREDLPGDRDRARRLPPRGRHDRRRQPGRRARVRHDAGRRAGAGRTQAGVARSAGLARRRPRWARSRCWLAFALLVVEWVSYHRRWTT